MPDRKPPTGRTRLMLTTLLLASCGGGGDGGTPPANGADTQPPTVAISAPAAWAAGITGTLNLSATASDDTAVAGVEFQLDGVALNGTPVPAPHQLGIDTTAWASGQHVLRARGVDTAGNRSAWASVTLQFGGSRSAPAAFVRTENWIGGLTGATAFAQAADGRLFVAQQTGALRVVRNGALQATPFVSLSVDSAGERGLIGVALHPDFANNRWVYLHHTTPSGGSHNRISRIRASVANPDLAEAGSEQVLVDLPLLSGATNHNGGALHFGSDGKLYVGVGDNANGALAPDLTSPLGKLLRFNDDGSIPADNPHAATQTGLARAIWARGLRNPYTFAVQPGSGRILINDVGQNTWEEINLGVAGADYGWPASEGPDGLLASHTAPLLAYRHSAAAPAGSGPGGFFVGFAIAGGAFAPDTSAWPAPWRGNYFFADFVSRFIGVLDLANGNAAYAFGSVSGNPVDLLTTADGTLLVLTRSGITRFAPP
jgi:glucose/arabinose dehydrogenase